MSSPVTSRPVSRTQSPAPREGRGRAGRDESPRRAGRPKLDRRESSPMARIATLGLLATSTLGGALGAPIASRDASPARVPLPEPTPMQPPRQISRLEQDMQQALNLIRRNEDPFAGVDWSQVDYSNTDWGKVDFDKINYDRGDVRADTPSMYGTPQAMPSPTLSSLGRAYETTFGSPSPLVTPPVPAKSVARGFSPTKIPSVPVVTPSPAPLLQVDIPKPQAPFQAPATGSLNFFEGVDLGQNAVAIAWHGDAPMTFSFFANAGPYQPNLSEAYKSVTLQPGGHETVQLPHGWSGRVQKMTGAIDSDATWAEITFNGWQDMTWYDVSAIRGYNGPAVMYVASAPGEKAGSEEDRLKQFPKDKLTMQPRGSAIPATEGYDSTIRFDVIDFWRAHAHDTPAHKEAYIVHDDDSATFTSLDKHLVTEWF